MVYDERENKAYLTYDECIEHVPEIFNDFMEENNGKVSQSVYQILETFYDYHVKAIQENRWMIHLLLFELALDNGYTDEYLINEVVNKILKFDWLRNLWKRQGIDEVEMAKREEHLHRVEEKFLAIQRTQQE